MRNGTIIQACLILFVAASTAFCEADFTETVSFGNSLTHNDLLWIYYSNPPDLYEMDPMEAVFMKGASVGDVLTNYAVAGSESGDVSLQIDLYELMRLMGIQAKATLFSFEIGGNDILNNDNLLAAYAPGEDPSADAVIDNLISNMIDGVARLRSSHPGGQFVIWTIPDVTLTPALWYNLTPEEADNIRSHTDRVNRLVLLAANRFHFVVVLDTYWFIQYTVENPPVILGHQLVPSPAYGDYDNIFADDIHPTAVSNALMANFISFRINNKWNDDIPLYTQEELADFAHIPYNVLGPGIEQRSGGAH
jgi:hypothetical protein